MINIQCQPNGWSCFPTCAAMLLDEPVSDIIREIGHDGSHIVWPQFDDCRKYQGFHLQEILDLFLKRGYTLIPIELKPKSISDLKCDKTHNVLFWKWPNNSTRFWNYRFGKGILLLEVSNGWNHVVVFEDGLIYDPDKENPTRLFKEVAYYAMVKLPDDYYQLLKLRNRESLNIGNKTKEMLFDSIVL